MNLIPSPKKQKGGAIVKVEKFLPIKKININQKSFHVSREEPSKKQDDNVPFNDNIKDDKSDLIITVEKKVIKIEKLLNDFLSFRQKENKNKKKNDEFERYRKRENDLEKKKPKREEKTKNIIPFKPKLGIFGWLTNFITNVVLGFIFVRLIDHLPKLIGLIPVINGVMDGVIDWGGKLLNGLVTFIDWGYSAYDNTVKIFQKFGGKSAAKNFENFIGKFKDVIQYSLIAGMLFSDLAMSSNDSGGGVDVSDFVEDGEKITKDAVLETEKDVMKRYFRRFGRDAFIERFGEEGLESLPKSLARSGLTKFGREAFVGLLGKGGAKTVLKFIKPFTENLPLIGGLLDFGLSVAMGENPGRAAFRAIGSTLLGVVGGAIGGPFAFLTGLAGGMIGDQIGGALYDVFFGNKNVKKPKRQWFDPRGWFGMKSGGVASTTRGGQYQSEKPRREIKSKKSKRVITAKPSKLKQGIATGGVEQLQRLFPEPDDIKSPPGTPSQTKEQTMNPFGFLSHSYYQFASVPFVGPLLAMPLKVMLGDTIDSSYYTSIGQGFDSLLNKAYTEGAFSNDFRIEEFDVEKIVSKSVEELASKEMASIRSDLIQQLMLKKLEKKGNNVNTNKECCPDTDASSSGLIPGNAPPEVKAMLEAISAGEGSWDSVNPGTTVSGLSNMTIAQARLAAMAKGYSMGGSGAMGKWQQMPEFILERARSSGLDPNKDKFSPENQTKIARMLMASVYPGGETQLVKDSQRDPLSAASKLRGTWPSLPGGSQQNTEAATFVRRFNENVKRFRGESPSSSPISPSSPAASVSDCSCDGNNVPDTNGIPGGNGSVGEDNTKGNSNQKRIYLHWTAGSYNDSSSIFKGGDWYGYHRYILGSGKVVPNQHPGHDAFGNVPPNHTWHRNTNSASFAVSGMENATKDNFGTSPIKPIQYESMASAVASLAKSWGWKSSDINEEKVMTHYEAAIKDGYSSERWDMGKLYQGDPMGSGPEKIRSMIKSKMGSAGKFGGGPINAGFTKLHPGEYVIDKDSVDLFGKDFMDIINEVENASQLKKAKQSLIQILEDIVPEYSENAPDEIIYNYIYVPASNKNIVKSKINNIQVFSNKSFGNPALDILSVG